MSEALQWSAAIVVLVAFALCQWGSWPARSYRYLLCNVAGGAGLSAAAFLSHQWVLSFSKACGRSWPREASLPV